MYYEMKTERLFLRPMNISDLQAVHEYDSDNENTRFMLNMPNSTIQETQEYLTNAANEWEKVRPYFYKFAIVLNGSVIGMAAVYLDEKREIAELGYILNKKYWGNGYALEAARAAKDFALNFLHVKKIFAHCDYRNAASARLMEKIGLKLESDDGVRIYTKRYETARELTYSFTVD